MLTTEIQQDTYTGPVTLNPRWLRMPSAVKYSGLSRSRLNELLGQRRIKSICLKSRIRETFIQNLKMSDGKASGGVRCPDPSWKRLHARYSLLKLVLFEVFFL